MILTGHKSQLDPGQKLLCLFEYTLSKTYYEKTWKQNKFLDPDRLEDFKKDLLKKNFDIDKIVSDKFTDANAVMQLFMELNPLKPGTTRDGVISADACKFNVQINPDSPKFCCDFWVDDDGEGNTVIHYYEYGFAYMYTPFDP